MKNKKILLLSAGALCLSMVILGGILLFAKEMLNAIFWIILLIIEFLCLIACSAILYYYMKKIHVKKEHIEEDANNSESSTLQVSMKSQHNSGMADTSDIEIPISVLPVSPVGSQIVTQEIIEKSHFDIGGSSAIGKREYQQDAMHYEVIEADPLQHKEIVAAVLCDGMGGMKNGEVASNLCVQKMWSVLEQLRGIAPEEVMNHLIHQVCEVDQMIYNLRDVSNNRLDAGTTLLGVYVNTDQLHWISVGDSRIYIIRGNQIIQSTVDHIYLNKLLGLVLKGEITYQEALQNPQKEALTSYIGSGKVELIDYNVMPFKLQKNDIVLLCSDGLYKNMTEQEIKMHIEANVSMQGAADSLINEVLEKNLPHQDNITVILLKYLSDSV